MIHDTKRVASIRMRTSVQLDLVSTLEEKIKKGALPRLQLARNQLGDIESSFLGQLERESRTPREEVIWLSAAEDVLQIWTEELKKVDEQLRKFGPSQVEIVGG